MTRRDDEGWLASVPAPDDDELFAVRRGVVHRRRPVNPVLPAVVAVGGLAAAVVGQFVVVLPRVETSLTERATTALRTAGFPKLQVYVDGRDITLNGTLPSLADVDRATAIVQDVTGVRVVREVFVSFPSTSATATPSRSATPSPSSSSSSSSSSPSSGAASASPSLPAPLAQLATLGATVDGGAVSLVGVLPSEAARAQLRGAVARTFGASRVDDGTTVDPAAGTFGAEAFARVVTTLGTGTRAGAVSLRTGRMSVAGVTADPGLAAQVAAAAAAAVGPDPTALANGLVVADAASAISDAQVGAQLQALLPIPFANGSSAIEGRADTLIRVAAGLLARHPQLLVQVEGHTDATGDPAANLALSRARAAAVVAALQSAGVPGSQLSAVGYGSTRPLSTQTGPAGDALNRRVVFVAAR